MIRCLRWQGLLVFLAFVSLLFGFWILAADDLARTWIEKAATQANGAEVNIDGADLMLFPLGFALKRIQVTDPDNPKINTIDISALSFTLDTQYLLQRKFIIDNMSIDGIKTSTKRGFPGFIVKEVKKKKEKKKEKAQRSYLEGISLPSFTKKDIMQILDKEKVASIELAKSLQDLTKERKLFWEKRLDELPDREKLEEYNNRIHRLQDKQNQDLTSILSIGKEIKSLQKDIKSDIKLLKNTRKEFSKDYTLLNEKIQQAQKAPLDDIRRLTKKYGPSPAGIGNVSSMLFGPDVGLWVERSLHWYNRIQPLLEKARDKKKATEVTKPVRAKGLDIHFKDYSPQPGFLIRRANASITLETGNFKGELNNITNDQTLLGIPLTYAFKGTKIEGIKSAEIHGSFDHINPSDPKDAIDIAMEGYSIKPLELGRGSLPLVLKKANIDMNIGAEISPGKGIDAVIRADARSTRFVIEESPKDNQIMASLSKAFDKVDGFSLKADVSGTPEDYNMKVRSDLDNVVRGVFEDFAKDLLVKFEARLKEEVLSRIEGPLKTAEQKMEGLMPMDKDISSRIGLAEDLLKSSLINVNSNGLELPF